MECLATRAGVGLSVHGRFQQSVWVGFIVPVWGARPAHVDELIGIA